MKTIIGYFDDYDRAVNMVEELVARNFGPEAIQIGRAAKERKIEGEMEEWFFEERVRGYYPAETRKEPAFVAISVSENDSMGVSHLMGHHGAIRVEEWPIARQSLF